MSIIRKTIKERKKTMLIKERKKSMLYSRMAKLAIVGAALCAASAACAHDADTVAFYSFANLTTGSSVTNGLVNEIDASTFPGRFEVGGVGDVVVSDDAPGDYIFSTLGHLSASDAVCQKPKSIYFGGTGADACKLLFDGMATYLSSNTAYTIEFFYKLADDAVAGGTSYPFVVWRGNWEYKGTQHADVVKFFLRNVTANSYAICLRGYADGVSTQLVSGDTTYPAGTCLRDGKWHHIALAWPVGGTENLNAFPERHYSPSEHRITNMKRGGVLDESHPVAINYSGNFKGWISCIRVSTKLRSNNDMLCASKLPTCMPQTVATGSSGSPTPRRVGTTTRMEATSTGAKAMRRTAAATYASRPSTTTVARSS